MLKKKLTRLAVSCLLTVSALGVSQTALSQHPLKVSYAWQVPIGSTIEQATRQVLAQSGSDFQLPEVHNMDPMAVARMSQRVPPVHCREKSACSLIDYLQKVWGPAFTAEIDNANGLISFTRADSHKRAYGRSYPVDQTTPGQSRATRLPVVRASWQGVRDVR